MYQKLIIASFLLVMVCHFIPQKYYHLSFGLSWIIFSVALSIKLIKSMDKDPVLKKWCYGFFSLLVFLSGIIVLFNLQF